MKKTYSIFLLGLGLILGGCGANYYVKQGNKKFDAFAYSDAVTQYGKAIAKKPDLYTAKKKLADSYRLLNKPVDAEANYREVVAMPESEPVNQFFFGKMLMQNKKYDEAVKAFNEYAKTVPNDPVVAELIDAAANPGKFDAKLDTCQYKLTLIDAPGFVNAMGASPYNFGYAFSGETAIEGKKGRDPYTGNSFIDLYFIKKDKDSGKWSAPEAIKGGVNSEYHDAFATFTQDGLTMYFTRTNQSKGKIKANKDNVANLEILKASFIEGEWSNIEMFPYNSQDFSNSQPALSPDGKTLYFNSDRPGGFGQSDIYACNWNGTSWDAPLNLGPLVNTAGREGMPQMGFDEKLYFSSDGHAGIGGLDIFSTTKNGGTWTQPINLKTPINSSNDDFSFTLDNEGKAGNLSSTRSGSDQMYEVIYKEPIIPVEVCLQDKESKKPVSGASVYARNNDTGELDSTFSNMQGKAFFRLKANFDFTINARSEKQLTNSIDLSTKGKSCTTVIKTCDEGKFIELEKEVLDSLIDIKGDGADGKFADILYDYNKWNIRPDAAIILDGLVKKMKNNPSYKFELGSHTDCRGTDAYNQVLSENRAKAVVKYCTNRGINAKRLTYKGYGETMPKISCVCESCTEDQHQQNRRTTFKLIK
jgi:peptidoglycan-associated lipoprotein